MGPLTLVRFDDVRQQADETKRHGTLESDPAVAQLGVGSFAVHKGLESSKFS